MDDQQVKSEYRCERCGKVFKRVKCLENHEPKCTGVFNPRPGQAIGELNVDYVKCAICGFAIRTLGKHLTSKHNITQEQYLKEYPGALITCEKSQAKFDGRGSNWDWIRRANERGEDLTEYKKKMGEAVSKSIMSNPEERKRRSELSKTTITKWATSEEGRTTASETAKETSARPDIIKARTMRLVNSYKPSKGEKVLQEFLTPFGFKRNILITSSEFTNNSQKRQIDFLNRDRKIAIEFDGAHHFKIAWKRMPLDRIRANDAELDSWCINHGYVLIRI